MKFTKMQGIGIDYVYVNCFEETVEDPCGTAKMVSDRHFGIGSDGLILIKPSRVADCQMDMYNLDGSRGAMCGNGIRCVGKYAYDHGIVDKTEIDVETASGIKHLSMKLKDGKVELVTVDMGRPVQTSEIGEPITVDGKEYCFTGVSMGNPHAVVFMDGIKDMEIEKIGPSFENHVCFPDRVNTEFVQVIDRHTVKMRVWERGSGETLACGTGACAVTVASILNDKVDGSKPVTVQLLGGDLNISWERDENLVYMTENWGKALFKSNVNNNAKVVSMLVPQNFKQPVLNVGATIGKVGVTANQKIRKLGNKAEPQTIGWLFEVLRVGAGRFRKNNKSAQVKATQTTQAKNDKNNAKLEKSRNEHQATNNANQCKKALLVCIIYKGTSHHISRENREF